MQVDEIHQLHLRNDLHLLRKSWHMFSGLTGLFLYFLLNADQKLTALIILGLGAANLIFELIRLKNEKLNNFFINSFGFLMRRSEASNISGFCYYAFGVSITLLLFEEKIAILAILFLIFSDPISSLFGILYGRDKILQNKSLQGCTAGLITCYVVTLLYAMIHGVSSPYLTVFAIVAGMIGMVSELFSNVIDDNITIPVISGIGLNFLNKLIPLF